MISIRKRIVMITIRTILLIQLLPLIIMKIR